MTIHLNPDQEHVVGEAIRAGLIERADDIVEVGEEPIRQRPQARSEPQSSDEWMRKFRVWAHSHPTDRPLLSDEAISRESIYRERGL